MRLLDFAAAPEESRQIINRWVSDETEEKIQDLIPSGAIDSTTRLVLTNAIYFNAGWLHPFEEASTQQGDFMLLDGSRLSVPMMSQTTTLSYGERDGVQIVELPYVGERVAMDIVLPGPGEFEGFEDGLTAEGLSDLLTGLEPKSVSLTMPKFKFESSFDQLAPTLADMGMPDATCAGAADFSGMDGSRNLCIGAVVHKAFVSVDEEGTEAAAATAVVMLETAMVEGVEIRVDRPFLFLIRDRDTSAILFLGRVLNPAE
jgi:serpin B